MIKAKTTLFFCLLILFAGHTIAQDTDLPYGIKYEQRNVTKILDGCDTSTNNDCPIISIKYDWMIEGENKGIFNKLAEKTILSNVYQLENAKYNTIEEMADTFISDYEGYRKEFPDAPNVGWYIYSNYENINELSQVISFSLSTESYTGGAHPNYFLTYLNYDYTTGEQVTLKQILIPGFEKELNKLVDKAFREKHDIKPNESLTDAGLFENKIEFNDNFLLTRNGIIFHYNIYEIWPYVYGATDVLVSYSDLIDLIDENGLGIY